MIVSIISANLFYSRFSSQVEICGDICSTVSSLEQMVFCLIMFSRNPGVNLLLKLSVPPCKQLSSHMCQTVRWWFNSKKVNPPFAKLSLTLIYLLESLL